VKRTVHRSLGVERNVRDVTVWFVCGQQAVSLRRRREQHATTGQDRARARFYGEECPE